MEQFAAFHTLEPRQWLALSGCGFTPRQLSACASLGTDGLFSKSLNMADLRRHKVRTQTAEKWLAFIAGETKISRWVDNTLHWLDNHSDSSVVWCCHADYPPLLLETNSPPLLLYVRGQTSLLRQPTIAMVGARNPTPQGKEHAFLFAKTFAQSGVPVVSGLAFGIDAACHKGALAAGNTLAVMGTGIDSVYPRQHQELAASIIASGTLVSEFPLGSKPIAGHFPRRNRIISGMALGVVVVEASIKSGSLITARYALDANREVFAIPGSIISPLSRGCHALIKEGAALVEDPAEVLQSLSIASPPLQGGAALSDDVSQLSPDLRAILDAMGYSNVSVDSLCTSLNMSASRVTSALIELELEGHVQRVPGGYMRLGKKP